MDMILADPLLFAAFAAALLATGAVAGVLAGLLGVGGGIVIVPVLFLLFPFLGVDQAVLMHVAVGTSLATIIPTSIMSARTHHAKGGVDIDLLKAWGPAIFVGVILGAWIGANVKGETLTLVFAVVAILVSLNMAFRKDSLVLGDQLPGGVFRYLTGLVIGGFSVVMGIGGGTLSVPILTAYSYPIKRAVGTASAIGLIIALPGAVSFAISGIGQENLPPFSIGYANLLGFALIVPATMKMAPVGARLAHRLDPAKLKLAFAFFLFITACRMFYNVLG